ncbi:fumarate hydratase class I, anaerobic [Mycolicibacterium conceptionense]|uniref:Fumarate hydratase class I, anaerobic n=1 Tax=Mycolicibacterium conceptionense TaxID=451644 RepID=A0A0U1DZ08_9MYCO|nr:fumarate hydratase class I, anaerobic [Mycolicibacterium conceptionense]
MTVHYTPLLPVGPDTTDYRRLDTGDVRTVNAAGRDFLEIPPDALEQLAFAAYRDVSHLLRTSHLRQVAAILDDPEASPNDRYVATELLRNANVAAGGVLPMCQDTGTAIVHAARGRHVLTDGDDAEHLSRGIARAYTTLNLRYSQLAPLSMFDERNTGTNLPAQIEILADGDDATASCSSPKAVAVPTRACCSSRPPHCSSPPTCSTSSSPRPRRSAPRHARPITLRS